MSFHSTALVASQATPLQQHPAFGAALTHLGRPPKRVWLSRSQRELQVMRRKFGPLWVGVVSRAEIARSDVERLREETDCRLLIVNAETAGQSSGIRLRQAAHVAELSLAQPASALRAQMAQKWRNRLNKAQNAGLSVSQTALPPDPDHWLLQADKAQQKAKGYRSYPAAFAAAYAAANRGQARLFEARQYGEIVAAMLFLCHGNVATYHIGWTGREGRASAAHHLVLWRAMNTLPQRGITRLDLGFVDTEAAPGLARFKLGSGARCRALGGTWVIWT